MRKHISKIEWGVLLKDVKDVDDLWGVVSSELQTAKNNRYLRKFTKIQINLKDHSWCLTLFIIKSRTKEML